MMIDIVAGLNGLNKNKKKDVYKTEKHKYNIKYNEKDNLN